VKLQEQASRRCRLLNLEGRVVLPVGVGAFGANGGACSIGGVGNSTVFTFNARNRAW
jgi:hypothetical protein